MKSKFTIEYDYFVLFSFLNCGRVLIGLGFKRSELEYVLASNFIKFHIFVNIIVCTLTIDKVRQSIDQILKSYKPNAS